MYFIPTAGGLLHFYVIFAVGDMLHLDIIFAVGSLLYFIGYIYLYRSRGLYLYMIGVIRKGIGLDRYDIVLK